MKKENKKVIYLVCLEIRERREKVQPHDVFKNNRVHAHIYKINHLTMTNIVDSYRFDIRLTLKENSLSAGCLAAFAKGIFFFLFFLNRKILPAAQIMIQIH